MYNMFLEQVVQISLNWKEMFIFCGFTGMCAYEPAYAYVRVFIYGIVCVFECATVRGRMRARVNA